MLLLFKRSSTLTRTNGQPQDLLSHTLPTFLVMAVPANNSRHNHNNNNSSRHSSNKTRLRILILLHRDLLALHLAVRVPLHHLPNPLLVSSLARACKTLHHACNTTVGTDLFIFIPTSVSRNDAGSAI